MSSKDYSFNNNIRDFLTPIFDRAGQSVGDTLGTGVDNFTNMVRGLFNSPQGQQQNPIQRPPSPTPTPSKQYSQPSPEVMPGQTGNLHVFVHPIHQVMAAQPAQPSQAIQQKPQAPTTGHTFYEEMLTKHILPVTRQYGIPDSLVAAQMAHESGYAQKPAGQYNYFGLKSNSHPGFASFNTPEDAATYYAQTIQALAPGLKSMKNNPLAVLQALQGHGKTGNYEGDNADPSQYVYDVQQYPEWKRYGGATPTMGNPWK